MGKLCPGSAHRIPNDHAPPSQGAHATPRREFPGSDASMRYREGMRLGWVVVGFALAGCASDSGASGVEFMDDDFPAGGCRDTDGATGGGTIGCDTEDAPTTAGLGTTGGTTSSAACGASNECMGGHCVAPWDSAAQSRGEFACEFACVAELDERQWCSDDAACCDAAATCTARGYCIVDGGSSTSDARTSTTGTTTGSTGA
jgi:hypothetical protein